MNITQAKQIAITDLLNSWGHTPTRSNESESWYLSPFRKEVNASFKVNTKKNIFFDFGDGFGGTVIDFVMKYNNCSISESLNILAQNLNVFSFHPQLVLNRSLETKKSYEITTVLELKNKNLIEYGSSRCLGFEILNKYCKEIHYQINDKNYYGLGFKNDLGGFEIRNKYVKMVLGKKEITTIKNNQNCIILFESWSDFVSFLTLYPEQEMQYDYIILNSVNMLEKALIQLYNCISRQLYNCITTDIYNYIIIVCCFDNDEAGNKATLKVKEKFPSLFKDGRVRYKNHKDLNDFLIAKRTNIGLRYIDGRD